MAGLVRDSMQKGLTVKVLLAAGADPSTKNKEGLTAAAIEIVGLLQEKP